MQQAELALGWRLEKDMRAYLGGLAADCHEFRLKLPRYRKDGLLM
jgi:hypothetical protein